VPPSAWADYLVIAAGGPGTLETLTRIRATLVVVDRSDQGVLLRTLEASDSGWRAVAAGEDGAVFRPKPTDGRRLDGRVTLGPVAGQGTEAAERLATPSARSCSLSSRSSPSSCWRSGLEDPQQRRHGDLGRLGGHQRRTMSERAFGAAHAWPAVWQGVHGQPRTVGGEL